MVKVGQPVPDFQCPASGGQDISLSALKGKHVVLYFYPKDDTPGCTKEGQGFRDNYAAFQAADTEILGVSRDSVPSHEKFIAKYAFPFSLLSDKEEKLCRLFDVVKEKNMYGRKVWGIERSTFVIDRNGILVREFRKVRVDGHVEEILELVQNLNAG